MVDTSVPIERIASDATTADRGAPALGGVVHVGDLVRSPALQLRVIGGAAGLRRRVSWAHVSELSDPTPWLFGSELIMTTGLALPRSARGQREYLARLDDAGVAGLAVSEGLHVPPLSRAFLAEADRRTFPVVEVPIPVPFMAIAQEVAAAVSVDTARRLSAQLQVFGAVRWLAAGELTSDEVFAQLERLSGYRLYACNPRGAPLLEGLHVPPAEHFDLIPRSTSTPPTVPGGYVVPVAGPNGHAGWVLALENPDTHGGGLSVVQHIATVIALRLAMLGQQREAWRREGAETFSEMMQAPMDAPRVVRRLGYHGFVEGEDLVVAITGPLSEGSDDGAVADVLSEAGHPHLLLRVDDDVYVLLPATEEAMASMHTAALAPLGISRPFRAGASLSLAIREARSAVATAARTGLPSVAYGDDPTVRWLTDDSAALQSLAHDVLGAVLRYDGQHTSELVQTVRIWLEVDRHTERAAQLLHIHTNTLFYRVRRFEELSGRTLSTTQGSAEVWLALRAMAHSNG